MKNNTQFNAEQDPHFSREAKKYERPVPSREYILDCLNELATPLYLEDFLDHFIIDDDAGKEGVRRRLIAMVRDGQLTASRDGAYQPFQDGVDTPPPARQFVVKPFVEEITQPLAIERAIRHYELPHEWNQAVEAESARFDIHIPESEIAHRRDLRDLNFVTIDGEDAKDFDDAVYAETLPNGQFKLIVAIADVSFYVRPDTALDEAACERGTSIYFPGKVVPMLPEVLSNELCSLKPKVDRLCLACEMVIDAHGSLIAYGFYQAVINSKARLTYNQVAAALKDPTAGDPALNIWPNIFVLYDLYKVLFSAREARGALDFDTVEGALILNDLGELSEIKPIQRNDAHRLIEEMMLMANVATATLFQQKEIPGIYRIHEGVRPEKFEDLKDFLKVRGIKLGQTPPSTKELSALLHQARSREDYPIVQTVLLRSLNQAIYSKDNVGHYGLAYEAYTHFTSPIRRYPDLMVHRLIRSVLNPKDKSGCAYTEDALREICAHTSHTERQADEASREVASTLKCGYIKKHLGATFTGIVSGVTGFGLFVTINDLLVDGLIHISTLPGDYYHFDPAHHRLTGEKSGRIFQLGQVLKIRVVKVNAWERKVDFTLA